MMQRLKIVIVEDELIAAEFLKDILEREGAKVVDIVDTGKDAISVCIKEKPDIVFMDIMLKDNMSGSEAAVEISRRTETQIIFLTAYSDPEMIDYAVESKAAGYLSKPYNKTEIIATMRLALAREQKTQLQEQISTDTNSVKKVEDVELVDGYIYSGKYHRLIREGQEVEVGPKALKLIELLSHQPNVSVSNEQIMLHIWGGIKNDKTLRSLVFRIRSTISENLIKNVSGIGYMIQSYD